VLEIVIFITRNAIKWVFINEKYSNFVEDSEAYSCCPSGRNQRYCKRKRNMRDPSALRAFLGNGE
jgi:hypothetical protein